MTINLVKIMYRLVYKNCWLRKKSCESNESVMWVGASQEEFITTQLAKRNPSQILFSEF